VIPESNNPATYSGFCLRNKVGKSCTAACDHCDPMSRRPSQHILPDVLAPNLRVVFCGTAAGTRSAHEGAYYAHPGNYFWRTLFEVGLTPRRLSPQEFPRVLDYGIGLTDLAKLHFGADHELPRDAFDAAALQRKLARCKPAIVAFTSKNAAFGYFGRVLPYGEQEARVAGSRAFVLPSPSGQARKFWDIGPWHELARLAKDR